MAVQASLYEVCTNPQCVPEPLFANGSTVFCDDLLPSDRDLKSYLHSREYP